MQDLQVFDRARALFERFAARRDCTSMSRSQFQAAARAAGLGGTTSCSGRGMSSAHLDILFTRAVCGRGASGSGSGPSAATKDMDLDKFIAVLQAAAAGLGPKELDSASVEVRQLAGR